ncbi:MAG: hypothetical protein HC836_39990 [Richelia sp. RM2_1_2]|nr:hypothetical protein [Richelia sp. RM2_1_2]
MRIDELIEHNKGDQGQSVIPKTFFNKLNLTVFHYFHRDNKKIEIYKATVGNQSYYTANRDNEIIAYVFIQQYDENVWQVKGSYIYNEQDRSKGIGTELYIQIVMFDNKKLISDDQLSDSAEKLWTKSLPKSGKDLKIYDVKNKKIYLFGNIGKQTTDGAYVLDPKNDNERDRNVMVGNINYKEPRFYYLLETTLVASDLAMYRKNRLVEPKYLGNTATPPLIKEWINEEKFFNWSFKLAGNSWY